MTEVAPLRLVDDEAAQAEPKVFFLNISVPAGSPWDQTRAATLEARLGAPLPLKDVSYRLKRLESWRPGRPARFAAFYARSSDAARGLDAVVDVDGVAVPVRFQSPAEQASRVRRTGTLALVTAVATAVIAGSFMAALGARERAEQKLASLAPAVEAKARLANQAERERRAEHALDAAGLRGHSLNDFLGDLAWASSAKAPGARIEAIHWDHGMIAVEARGDAPPLVAGDRTFTKVDKALRPGVWLWGVSEKAPSR